ncbi:MAG: nitronate monooxygenase [Gammaproteobacteria bacterium]|nr:MAG: nitronate monooxygenase [Gammaproteobacteria bacterium]
MWSLQARAFLKKLGIQAPIIQAPMAGGATTPRLVANVSNADGLGSIGGGYLSAEEIRKSIRETRALTQKPFCVNLFTPTQTIISERKIQKMVKILSKYNKELKITSSATIPMADSFDAQLEVIIEEKVPVVSFTFGIPTANQIQKLKAQKIILIGTATTVKEGIKLAENGCDFIVAQGSEAGGHRGSFLGSFKKSLIGTMALVPQLVDAVNVPVIAAGGIMDGRGLGAALMLGAAGVQMGTAFLTCPESGVHKKYKEAILKSNEESTVVTTVFSGKLARGIQNKFIEEMEKYEEDILEYPFQHYLTQPIRKESARQDQLEWMSLWAGQGTRLSKELPADELIKKIIEQLKELMPPQQ